jgi:hypothetical protein
MCVHAVQGTRWVWRIIPLSTTPHILVLAHSPQRGALPVAGSPQRGMVSQQAIGKVAWGKCVKRYCVFFAQ